ncbi:ribosome biogenesis protein WDR12 homolog [Apium graveolens]|uniref:ribosome biogenesis protein WDR12 homolog n=1 Tax=Apium graveolens TaxID=4045 RepID=UPI003D7BEBA8
MASGTNITDVSMDSLIHCASFLNLQDISNLSITCKYLNTLAYSDSIWRSFFRERWPQQAPPSISKHSSVREAYITRNSAVHQFKFVDPFVTDYHVEAKHFDNLFVNQDRIVFSQGPSINIMNIDSSLKRREPLLTLRDHNARVSCMRFYSLNETSLFRSGTQRNEKVLVTSSYDHSIRLWWKGSCQRCFRGHSGPVTTLSDRLLGEGTGKVFASGGDDGTVRLWSLSSSGKRGQHALKATLYGHGKPLALMSVAGHKSSLLVSMSKDSKVRLWDTATSSSSSSCCVGMTSIPGAPVGLKCNESLLFVAAGSSVVAIDLRTMKKVFSTPYYQPRLYSFEMLPSKFLICTGGMNSAMLWDMRTFSETVKAKPLAELDGHIGPVKFLHLDWYKVVSGSPEDQYVNVWESDTGRQTNILDCNPTDGLNSSTGCSAMAVNGCQIVTGSFTEEQGVIRYRDFNNATSHVLSEGDEGGSKFWGSQ